LHGGGVKKSTVGTVARTHLTDAAAFRSNGRKLPGEAGQRTVAMVPIFGRRSRGIWGYPNVRPKIKKRLEGGDETFAVGCVRGKQVSG